MKPIAFIRKKMAALNKRTLLKRNARERAGKIVTDELHNYNMQDLKSIRGRYETESLYSGKLRFVPGTAKQGVSALINMEISRRHERAKKLRKLRKQRRK